MIFQCGFGVDVFGIEDFFAKTFGAVTVLCQDVLARDFYASKCRGSNKTFKQRRIDTIVNFINFCSLNTLFLQ